jgi:hypothetical protein
VSALLVEMALALGAVESRELSDRGVPFGRVETGERRMLEPGEVGAGLV